MKKKILYLAILLALVLSNVSLALAEDYQSGEPTPAEIEGFKKQFEGGGPPENIPEPQIPKPPFEEPGRVPEEVKQYVNDKDLVPIYCAMTRWKSGDFFSAMDAVNKYVIGGAKQIQSDFNVSFDMPDTEALKTEAEKKLQEICNADTSDEADKLVRDFISWSQNDSQAKFQAMNKEMQDKLKGKSDELKAKINQQVETFVAGEVAKIQEEMKAEGQNFAKQKQAEFESGAKPISESQMKAEFTSSISSKINGKKADLEAKIKTKIKEIVGGETEKFKNIGKIFEGVGDKINADIAANKGQYEKYHQEALKLRREQIMKVLDANLAEAFKQLDASAANMAEAKKTDPTIKDAEEIKAAIQKDRQELEVKIDAALAGENEAGVQSAIGDFKVKWETIRAEGEKMAKESSAKACSMALPQLSSMVKQLDGAGAEMNDVMNYCQDKKSQECAGVTPFLAKMQALINKMNQVKKEVALANNLCANPQQTDRQTLISLFMQIKTDSNEIQSSGQALEADGRKVEQETRAAAEAAAKAENSGGPVPAPGQQPNQ